MTLIRSLILNLFIIIQLSSGSPAIAGEAKLKPWADNDFDATLSLRDYRDEPHDLSDYRGKVVLINFWASWCPPCITEMPALKKLKQKLSGSPFEILAVNVGEKRYKVRKFVKLINFDLTVPLDISQDTFRTWGAQTLPTSFIIDASGKVRYWVRGDPDWNNENTVSLIKALIAESEKPPANTPRTKIETTK
jgi:thiol-disulfide isomerase/thioredoxin